MINYKHYIKVFILYLIIPLTACGQSQVPLDDIDSVYLSENENALLIDSGEIIGDKAYEAKNAILQLIETSKDNSWAIVISMPDELDGRVETTYELIDLISGKAITGKFQEVNSEWQEGSPIWFDENDIGTFVVSEIHNVEIKIELKHSN